MTPVRPPSAEAICKAALEQPCPIESRSIAARIWKEYWEEGLERPQEEDVFSFE